MVFPSLRKDTLNYDNVFSAIEFAVQAHRGQLRKATGVPYVVHPIAVGRRLMEIGSPESLVLAGFLHDTLEDTDVEQEKLQAAFSDPVAELVLAVTESDKALPWERRKEEMLAHLEQANSEVLVLSLADKLDNIQSIQRALMRLGEDVWSRFNQPRAQQAWYYGRLAGIFTRRIGDGSWRSLLEPFNDAVLHVFRLNSLEEIPSWHKT
jgi:(p)ppGpp synthase/HD superfamily hydrolase